MKRILCLAITLCLLLSAIPAQAGEYVGRMMVVNCKKCVSLRERPTTESERIMWVDYHQVLENCRSGYGEYYYVECDGVSGYIHSDYLEVYEGDGWIFTAESYDEMQIVDCPEWTPLREMADVNAEKLAELPLGAVVHNCLFYADDFTYVEYEGLEGYVLTEYVTLGTSEFVEPELGRKYVTNCHTAVSLRAEPTTESERLAWVPKDTVVRAYRAEDGYYYVRYEGMYGYIFGDYLAQEEIDYAYVYTLTEGFREQLREKGAAFGLYLITGDMGSDQLSYDPDAAIGTLPEDWRQIAQSVPQNCITGIQEGQELYLIIPASEYSQVRVNSLQLGYDGFTGLVDEELYFSEYGEPVMMLCNEYWAVCDCEIIVTEEDGNEVHWYPGQDLNTGRVYVGAEGGTCYDFTVYE